MACLLLLGGGGLRAEGDGEPAGLLCRARRAIADRDRVAAWKAIDGARSNFPEVEAQARDLVRALDAICTEDQKVGRVAVATWPDRNEAATSLTFDDSLRSGYRQAAPDLERLGWLGTYYLTDKTLQAQDKGPWKALALRGHEVGCHTVSHFGADLPARPQPTIEVELNCGTFLTPAVTDEPILTFAYPDSNSGDASGPLRATVRRRYLAARSGKAGDGQRTSRASPEDMDVLISFPVLWVTNVSEFEQELGRAVRARGWLIFMFHGVVEREGWQYIGRPAWQGCLDLVRDRNRDGEVWVAPMADVAGYIQARRTAVTDWRWDGHCVRVSVRSELGRTPPDTSLTVTVRVPRSWREVAISTEDDSRTVRDGEVTFNLRPDGGQVTLEEVRRPGGVGP